MSPIAKVFRLAIFTFAILAGYLSLPVVAQDSIIVQPGAPGQPTKVLPSTTRAILPPISSKDVEFMQGMVMHHAQAVEMTALIADRSKNKKIHLMGTRISRSQLDEMLFMKRWLEMRGKSTSHSMPGDNDAHSGHGEQPAKGASHKEHLMPGMLSAEQMRAMERSKGAEFDRLFLQGMIQHHDGALIMVKDLFATAGAGQDAELFTFATDVDTGQRAEIKSMQTILSEFP